MRLKQPINRLEVEEAEDELDPDDTWFVSIQASRYMPAVPHFWDTACIGTGRTRKVAIRQAKRRLRWMLRELEERAKEEKS